MVLMYYQPYSHKGLLRCVFPRGYGGFHSTIHLYLVFPNTVYSVNIFDPSHTFIHVAKLFIHYFINLIELNLIWMMVR